MNDTEILQAIVRHRLMVDVVDGETTVCGLRGPSVTTVHAEHGSEIEATREAIKRFAAQQEEA